MANPPHDDTNELDYWRLKDQEITRYAQSRIEASNLQASGMYTVATGPANVDYGKFALTYENLKKAAVKMKTLQTQPRKYLIVGENTIRASHKELLESLQIQNFEEFITHAKARWVRIDCVMVKISSVMPDLGWTEIPGINEVV